MKTIIINNIEITIIKHLPLKIIRRKLKNGNYRNYRIPMIQYLCISCKQPKQSSIWELRQGRNLRCISCGQGVTRYINKTELTKDRVEEVLANNYLSILRGSVVKRNGKCKLLLSLKEIIEIIFKDCNYCGIPPDQSCRDYPIKFHGIDRIDSNGHYEITNCVSCCKVCNYVKRLMTINEFYIWLDRIAKFNGYNRTKYLELVA